MYIHLLKQSDKPQRVTKKIQFDKQVAREKVEAGGKLLFLMRDQLKNSADGFYIQRSAR